MFSIQATPVSHMVKLHKSQLPIFAIGLPAQNTMADTGKCSCTEIPAMLSPQPSINKGIYHVKGCSSI
jgi:hypothetical protein